MSVWQESSQSSLHDYSHLGDELRSQLENWSEQVQDEPLRSLLGTTSLRQLRHDFDFARKRLDADFTLVVAGDFKRGKSTLINALVGAKVASSNPTPETVTINRFVYGKKPLLVATLVNGAKIPLQPEDIALERLEPILEKLGAEVRHLQAEVDVPWLQGVTLVDTPGMGDLLARFDQQVIEYLVQADSVIYVISALSPLSESEERFLRQSLAVHEFPKLTFVVNMIDHTQNEEETQRLLERIEARIYKLFPQSKVFAVSALDELARQVGAGRPNPSRQQALEGYFAALRGHLEEAILLNRQRIQLDRACELAGQAFERLQKNGERLRTALQSDQKQLELALRQCENGDSELHGRISQEKEELASAIQGMGQQATGWMMEFCDRFETQVLGKLTQSKVERVQRYFPFFLSEVTREALTACVCAHQAPIVEQVQKCQRAFQSDFERLASATQTSQVGENLGRQALWSAPWSGQETFQLVMTLTGLGELLNIMLDKKKQNQQLEQFAARIVDSMPRFREALKQQVPQVYGQLTEKILNELQSGYELELSQSSAAIRQVQEMREKGLDQGGKMESGLNELSQLCQQASLALEDLEQRLWFSESLSSVMATGS